MRVRTARRLRRDVARRHVAEGYQEEVRCAYCGALGCVDWTDGEPFFYEARGDARKWMHLDHVIPESRNGPTSLDNTVIACADCNLRKGALPFGDAGFQAWLHERRLIVAEIEMQALGWEVPLLEVFRG